MGQALLFFGDVGDTDLLFYHRTLHHQELLMSTVSLPPEVWCHILSYLSKNDIDAVIATKRLNRLSYNELKDRDPQLLVQDVNWATLRGNFGNNSKFYLKNYLPLNIK